MIVDHTVLTRAGMVYDLIVVGAGAAGLTLATAAAAKGLRILLIEAGGRHETKAGRAALAGELVTPGIHPSLDLYRVRALGGASRIWGGRCLPLDPIDFEARPWIVHSGWPVSYGDVARYYSEATAIAEAGQSDFDPVHALPFEQHEMARGLDGRIVRTTVERFSRPTNFWTRFSDTLATSTAIDVLPNTRLLHVGLEASGNAVNAMIITDAANRRYAVRARHYALAQGGLETARILLASRDVKPAGIGNDFDQLGRYYMSHLCTTGSVVEFAPTTPLAHDYTRDAEGIYLRRRLWITDEAQRAFRLTNVTFRTHLPTPGDPAHGNAILSAMFLTKSLVQREYATKFSEGVVSATDYLRHAGNIARQPRALSRFALMWLKKRILSSRKLPSVVLPSADRRYQLEFHAEQIPNFESRVSLSSARDGDGVPRLKVDWRLCQEDVEALVRAHYVLQDEIARTGTGMLIFDPATLRSRIRQHSIVGGHHIGTTRMSDTPQTGVVDFNCRVHGVANLFVASASVMPTSGQANPTLTIIALALRLADHLAERQACPEQITVSPHRRNVAETVLARVGS